jgi:hypothetical protein
MTTAQMLCETKMAEVAVGLIPAMPASATPILDFGSGNDWLFTVETQQVGQDGLLAVRVVVEQNPEMVSRPVSFALLRWMIDPSYQATSGSTSEAGGSSTPSI